MYKFHINYVDNLSKEEINNIKLILRSNFYNWMSINYFIYPSDIKIQYKTTRSMYEIKHEFIIEFDLESNREEAIHIPSEYQNYIFTGFSKFGDDIIYNKRYSNYLDLNSNVPNSYYFEEV